MNACIDAPLTLIQEVWPEAGGSGGAGHTATSVHAHSRGTAASSDRLPISGYPHDKRAAWLLVCSHACDVACILLLSSCATFASPHDGAMHSHDESCMRQDGGGHGVSATGVSASARWSQRLWTATVGGSPDAGLQVTACATCVAVACMNGCLELLRLRSGERLASVDASGQLRRCCSSSVMSCHVAHRNHLNHLHVRGVACFFEARLLGCNRLTQGAIDSFEIALYC
jgi:hypothetical protein